MSKSSSPTKLALLVCGSLTGSLKDTYGDYTAVFGEFLQRALPKDVKFILDPYDVVFKMEYPPEDKIDTYEGIIYTGSAASAYEDVEWINKLVSYTAHIAKDKPNVKLIGICFGHQIIGRALGAECVPNNGKWEVGPTTLDLTELGKELFGVETLNIQQMHRDHVPTLPPNVQLLASTPVSYNQGMVRFTANPESAQRKLNDVQIFTLQGHPEFVEGLVTGLVEVRAKSGIIDAETAADSERRKGWRNDGVPVIGKAIWGILGVTA
ncbi:putative glutamine amidotransferase-like protein C13C5.04 [Hypsizygus marmoreus]|uniref:Glutamine amidotransferase-like protein C13C5.04 n=1 Tax=Hypsizygus marmoreus TaxID=39966 RepID=A0A369JZQ1_HYPMA|nr:putative glutamine amidotransferase-like protein C13C5.04 [Hypsizygus marmoreus]